jgi:hypothetical protein
MSRIVLAFSAFFRLLFGGKLPPEAVKYLPEGALPKPPEAKAETKAEAKAETRAAPKEVAKGEAKPKDGKPPGKTEVNDAARPEAKDIAKEPDRRPTIAAAHKDGALALLALLQREGRLVDFLREPLDGFSDADIGAAARDVHRGCRKVLEQHLKLEAVMPGAEEDKVTVPRGFDPAEVRIVGEAKGEPPYRGTLRHHGWRATEVKLPALTEGVDRAVVAPAEVELGS